MSLRIILADDHPVVLLGARAVLASSGVGHVVAEAKSARELMEALARHPCDVLVTDFSMPDQEGVDGIPMIRQIRRLHPELPVILLSSATNLAILRLAAEAGVLGMLDKGGSLDDLPVAILTVHRGLPFVSHTHERRVAESGDAPTEQLGMQELSPRETEVLRLLASGLTVTEISERLHRQISTVSRQKRDAMRKLGISADAELFAFFRSSGFC